MKVLLLHAFPLDERMWDPQRDALADYELETPNIYALGGSSIEGWAYAVLRQVWDEFVAVGASMGGYLALALARLAPERLRGLVLAGSRADADPPERTEQRQRRIALAQDSGAEALWREMESIFAGAADEVRSMALERRTGELVDALRAVRDRPDLSDIVPSLEIPVLVAVGDADELVSVDEAKALAKSAKKGKVEVFEGAGHLPSVEQPEAFNRKLLDFLAKV